jgi:acyl-CoA synthetase (AMP-forming)/AMP-acid ligase II
MCSSAVHRLIEQQAAARGDMPAIIDDTRSLSYRELNQRANLVARCLILHAFRRGHLAIVNMPRCPDLVVVCLGVLKAGGAFTWIDADSSWPPGISFHQNQEDRYMAVDVSRVLTESTRQAPNLPIVTRPDDLACVIGGPDEQPQTRVAHAAITALQSRAVSDHTSWSDDPLELWVGLMAGAAVSLRAQPALTAA